jgi:mannosyl-oligosaccharide alpha-1,2-mannosidase
MLSRMMSLSRPQTASAIHGESLNPSRRMHTDDFHSNKWGASAVDALSTALVMGQKDIVNQIIDYIPTINWSETPIDVSLFETTIRYLGGMISGYDFLSGPLAHLANSNASVSALLTQSINLANNLSYAFETPTGIPYNNLDFSTRGNDGSNNGLATVGTLILEWVRLTDLSGNKTYAELVEKAEQYLLHPSPASSEPFPGLLGMNISPLTGEFQDAHGGWIGGADSFYEYLIKMYIYDPIRYSSGSSPQTAQSRTSPRTPRSGATLPSSRPLPAKPSISHPSTSRASTAGTSSSQGRS